MFHFFEAITDNKGNALTGFYVRVTDSGGAGVSLYADNSATPIISVSGLADAARVNTDGNAEFYCPVGVYTLNIYASDGVTPARAIPNWDMSMDVDTAAAAEAAQATATTAASSAATSASAAATSATNAASSATAAAGSASSAASSATSSSNSAAQSAASAAQSSSSYNAIAAAIAPGSLNNATVKAATRTILAGLSTTLPAYLTEAGREGMFVFDSTNISANVSGGIAYGDTAKAIYVLPSWDTTGASGAWVRKFVGAMAPEWFGATGDGVTDDYAAWQAMLSYVNNRGGGKIQLGRGKTYFINQHVVSGNGITDLQLIGCNGLVIEGNGAKISFQGNFDRNVSTTRGLSFIYQECNNVVVSNLEVTGNVDQTTNSGGFNETICYGQLFYGCTNVKLTNVHCHHMATDGFAFQQSVNQFGGLLLACRRVTMENCKGAFNGRMGVFISQCRGFKATNCNFDDQAQFAGTYGVGGINGHAPRSGLDIEPNFNTATASPHTMDINTGDIVFERCTFRRNKSGLLFAQLVASIDTVTFRSCSGDAAGSLGGSAGIVLAVPNVLVDNCQFDLGDNYFKFCESSNPLVTGVLKDSVISGTYMLLSSQLNSGRVEIDNTEFICTCTAPYTHGSATPILASNSGMTMERCRFFMPAVGYVAGAGGAHQVVGLVIRRQRNNRWETDLTATALGQTTAHYHANNFSGGTNISEEHFIGTATGTADTFRPSASVAFDTTYKFTRVPGYAGVPGTAALTDASYTHSHAILPAVAVLDVPLTASRSISLSTTGAVAGAELQVVRTANSTGAFSLTVNGKNLSTGQWARVRYNGTAWVSIGFGSL